MVNSHRRPSSQAYVQIPTKVIVWLVAVGAGVMFLCLVGFLLIGLATTPPAP